MKRSPPLQTTFWKHRRCLQNKLRNTQHFCWEIRLKFRNTFGHQHTYTPNHKQQRFGLKLTNVYGIYCICVSPVREANKHLQVTPSVANNVLQQAIRSGQVVPVPSMTLSSLPRGATPTVTHCGLHNCWPLSLPSLVVWALGPWLTPPSHH